MREGACSRASIRLLNLWKIRLWEVPRSHLCVHAVLRWGNVLLVIVIATKSVCIGLLESTIKRRHLSLHTTSHVALKHWQLGCYLRSLIAFYVTLLYVPVLIFLRRCARNFTVFCDEGCLELLYLLVVFHFLALNLGHNCSIHWNVLLRSARSSIYRFGCLAIQRRTWDLWSTLHL